MAYGPPPSHSSASIFTHMLVAPNPTPNHLSAGPTSVIRTAAGPSTDASATVTLASACANATLTAACGFGPGVPST
eukprot:3809602-Rhodomonas_salina.2